MKGRLLKDAKDAIKTLGIDVESWITLVAVENTDDIHNVIVCMLCSCYPRALLGLPPDWYKSLNYRARVVREPRAVLKEFGLRLPASVTFVFMIALPICGTCCSKAPFCTRRDE